jgi:hypothetical protein
MTAARRLIEEAEERGVRLYILAGRVKFACRGGPPADLLERLRAAKEEIEAELSYVPRRHPCAVCGGEGVNGFNWTARAPERAVWYCSACKPNKKTPEQRAALLDAERAAVLEARKKIEAGETPPPDAAEADPLSSPEIEPLSQRGEVEGDWWRQPVEGWPDRLHIHNLARDEDVVIPLHGEGEP